MSSLGSDPTQPRLTAEAGRSAPTAAPEDLTGQVLAGRYEVLARNVLDDGFDASAALVDNELFLRGQTFLYCIANPGS